MSETMSGYVVLMSGDREVSQREPVDVEVFGPASGGRVDLRLFRDVSFEFVGGADAAVLVLDETPFCRWPIEHELQDGDTFDLISVRPET